MPLVTLSRYLSGSEDKSGYRKVITVLLNGIANHGACAGIPGLDDFNEQMRAIQGAFDPNCSVEQLFVTAGATIQALDSYNARMARLIRRQGTELQNMISMLTQTVITISGATDRSSEALHDIRHELEQAAEVEDVQNLKVRLSDCLKKVCDEATRQKSETEAVLLELQASVQNVQNSNVAEPAVDPVTALPKQEAAKTAFVEGLKSPGRKYIVTIVVDRLQPINARFGNAAGDQVLREVRKYIEAKVIVQGDLLFRWTGPAMVVLTPRQERIDEVRAGLKRLLDARIETEIDLGGRSALVPLSLAWSVMALIPPVANVSSFIDKFVAAQVPKDY